MDAILINSFSKATVTVIETMAATKVECGKPYIKEDANSYGVVTGLIGMAGDKISGNLAISFDEAAVLEIVSNMLQETFSSLTPDVVDAVGEMTNIICGNAKSTLFDAGYKFDMATPAIIVGKDVTISQLKAAPVLVLPFSTPKGKIVLEASFKKNNSSS